MQTIKKWGNSLAFRIPLHMAKELGVDEDTPVECGVRDGALWVKPIKTPKYTLEQLLAGITPENLHKETEVSQPTGNEIW